VDNAEMWILPEQYLARRQGEQQPLRRLMIALLEDAILTFQRHLFAQSEAGRRLFSEAETWLMDENPGLPLRFEDVCDVLDLDAGFLRRMLRGWRARAVASGEATVPVRRGGSSEAGRVIRLEPARRQRALASPRSRAGTSRRPA